MSIAVDPSYWGAGPFVQRRLSPWVVAPPTDYQSPSGELPGAWVVEEPPAREICEEGLRLLCLAVIKQARLDARRKSYELKAPAVRFLQTHAPLWLKVLGINRRYGDEEAYKLIYDRPVLRELWEEEEDEDEFE